MLAGVRLRAGRAGSGEGAAWIVTEAIATARAAGATGEILLRGDSAYGNSAVIAAASPMVIRSNSVQPGSGGAG